MTGAAHPAALPVPRPVSGRITLADRWDHLVARLGVDRMGHRVGAGLYSLGSPGPDSPVFVTANYTLSFDALREALAGRDCYIMVLETYGVNVWCAAGKGTFSTDEMVRRIEATGLGELVRRRALIVPQLGATGVAAHEVARRSGFRVEFGPVRARDLPEYLKTHSATPEMRRVRFTLADRIAVAPVDLVHVGLPMVASAAAVFLFGGLLAAVAVVAAFVAGTVLFPILLPWLPTRDFTSKGLVVGLAAALPFAVAAFAASPAGAEPHMWQRLYRALIPLLALPPATAYLALNFTGSSTFSSKSGVKREMMRYIPALAVLFGVGVALGIGYLFLRGGRA
ncbi:MAG: mercury methylation corrinoid protein HgcA [bacterium]